MLEGRGCNTGVHAESVICCIVGRSSIGTDRAS